MNKKVLHKTFYNKMLLLKLVLYCAFIPAKAQQIKADFDSYTTKDGLSQNNIVAIAQDKKGFMWFASEEGLNRFDGHDFKQFRYSEQDSLSIISSHIRALLVDEDNSIWIGTDSGLCRYFPEKEYLQHYPIDHKDDSKLNGRYISDIRKHPNGSIWISYLGSGVDVISAHSKKVLHYTIHRNDGYKLNNDLVTGLQFLKDGYTLVGTYGGLQALNSKGLVMEQASSHKKFPWLAQLQHSIRKLLLSRDGKTLWIGTDVNGVYRVNLENNLVSHFDSNNTALTSNEILSLFEDSRGQVWIGADAIYTFNAAQNTINWFSAFGMHVKSHTQAIYEDKEQNLWMGTIHHGVRKISFKDTKLAHYHANQGEGSLKSDEILAFNQDEGGRLWVATAGAGLQIMGSPGTGFRDAEINASLSTRMIKTIFKDAEGYFWVGGWDAGLIRFNPGGKHLNIYHPNRGNFKSRHVWDIAQDQQGHLWLATLRDGLCRFTPKNGQYKYFRRTAGDTTSLLNDDVQGVHVDRKNVLWVATSHGLSVLLPGSERFINTLLYRNGQKRTTAKNVFYCLYEDKEGKMWLGTKGGGVLVVSLKGNKLQIEKTYTEKDGLPSNHIAGIQADKNQNIWVSTSNGLARISHSTAAEVTPVFSTRGNDYLPQSNFSTSEGRMYFGGPNGFNSFHPDSLILNPGKAAVLFTSLKVINDEVSPNRPYKGRTVLNSAITDAEEIALSHEDYAVTISFAPVSYTQQNNIKYAYLLENFDKEWQYTTSARRFAHYTNLAPGSYLLKVKASYDGVSWPGVISTLKINVSPPWWATSWFRTLALLLSIGILYSAYKLRTSFLSTQRRKLEKLVIQRTAELRSSNEEIKALLREVAQQKDSIENANEELQQINEEVGAQRDTLQIRSQQLEAAQLELRQINTSLEQLVAKRTHTLNSTLQELETFLYRASHDLRGPIASMLGLLMVARMENKKTSGDSTYFDLLQKPVLKLERTLQKLLYKYTIQQDVLVPECFSRQTLEDLLIEIKEDIKFFRHGDFCLRIDPNILLTTDRKLLSIILICLLENAFFYSQSSKNSQVVLEIRQEGDRFKIAVSDHGVGVAPDQTEKIFNMFYRGSLLSNGNGLGLYLVKCALERLNGAISVHSEPDAFSIFTISLPAVHAQLQNTFFLEEISR